MSSALRTLLIATAITATALGLIATFWLKSFEAPTDDTVYVEDFASTTPALPACRAPDPAQPVTLEGCGIGDVLVLRGVTFQQGSNALNRDQLAILDDVRQTLGRFSGVIQIDGHTSSDESPQLASRRAAAVRAALGDINPRVRLTVKGYGESQPVADNETPEGRSLNRRVEFRVVEGSSYLQSIDAQIGELPLQNAGVTWPATISEGHTARVLLRIDPSATAGQLGSDLRADGSAADAATGPAPTDPQLSRAVETAQVRVSQVVLAELIPSHSVLHVSPEGRIDKALSEVEQTQWEWQVEASQPGSYQLKVHLYARIESNTGVASREVRTWTRDVQVIVKPFSFWKWLGAFLQTNLLAALAGAVSPVLAWLIHRVYAAVKERRDDKQRKHYDL